MTDCLKLLTARYSTTDELSPISSKSLDFRIDTCRQVEFHQRIHCLRSRIKNIHQPLVGANLELLPRFLVDVGRLEHRPLVFNRRKRYWTRNSGAGSFGSLNNLGRGLIEHPVIVSFQPNSDFVAHKTLVSRAGDPDDPATGSPVD